MAEVERKFTAWLQQRQAHEPQWFMNAAFFRGQQGVTWSAIDNRLVSAPSINPNRTKRQINRLFAKVRARRAKFLKNRPTWVVVPATTDIKDKLDARATGKVLDYIWRRAHLDARYRDAVLWAETASRGYWWFHWNPDTIGRVLQDDPMGGPKKVQEAVVGDVEIEVGSPFEVLVGDPGAGSLSGQYEIIRVKERSLAYVRERFPEKGQFVAAESPGQTFSYETQISSLNTTSGVLGSSGGITTAEKNRDADGSESSVIVKEYFRRPSADLPKGKYCVVANNVLLKEEDELPFGFYDMDNPFPCVEFVDIPTVGQYWGTTVIEQLIDLQREYNGIRSMISTNIKLMGHPKVFVPKQAQIPEGAWTPDAGEIIEYNARPGMPEPKPWIPPNIIGDAWKMIDLLRSEFDDVSQIYPSAEGKAGGSSGFETNLLQEAADAVHAPDLRCHELAIEESAFKVRRIVKQGYQLPRLITVTSASYNPEMFEFGAAEVDEYADIIVQAGSALPMLKGARIQAALDLFAKGVLGDPADPQVRRRLLNNLELGGMDDIYEYNRVDEDMINIENAMAEDGSPLPQPRFFENHQEHWTGHINKLKSPSVLSWPPEARMELLKHSILHSKYINQAAAYQMSIEAGLEGLIPPPPPVALPVPGSDGQPGQGGPPQQAQAAPSPSNGLAEAPDQTPAAGTPFSS